MPLTELPAGPGNPGGPLGPLDPLREKKQLNKNMVTVTTDGGLLVVLLIQPGLPFLLVLRVPLV